MNRAALVPWVTLWLCAGCVVDSDPQAADASESVDLADRVDMADVMPPDMASPDMASPDMASPDMASPDMASPDMVSPDMASPDMVSPDMASPDMASPDAAPADLGLLADAAPDMAPDADPAPGPDYERDPALLELRGPCPRAERFGGFKVESNDAEGYTAIDGNVRDSIVAGQVLEETLSGGGCALLRRGRLICEPVCEPGSTCDSDNVCVPSPRGQDMGPTVFQGLVQPLTLEALQPGNTYFFTRLPHPGFEPGTVLHLSNTPGFVGPLDLYGVGVEPLVMRQDAWVITEGEALSIRWEPPVDAAHARLYFELNIDQHGLTPVSLVCALPDTGEVEVPVAMTDALIAAGVTGFPTGRVARRTSDSQRFDGRCVDFVVSSVRPIDEIEVTGFRPCVVHEDCPSGLCDLEIQQCL